jgi:nucleoside-diphosphate-sugar epimerase
MINEILGKNIEPRFEPDRAGDVKHSLAGITKAREILGYEVRVDFKEGLRRTIDFYK